MRVAQSDDAGHLSGKVEQLLRQLRDLRVERPRLELQSLAEQLDQDGKGGETPEGFVVRRNQKPWCAPGRGLLQHVLDGALVVRPVRAVAKILVGQLPALERVAQAVLEPAHLLD